VQPAQQAAETKINAKAIVETIREDAAKERVLPMWFCVLMLPEGSVSFTSA
jgi:hypothetical protein